VAVPLLIIGTLCFMSIGLLSGAVAKTTEGAVNMANFLVLPMAFLSGSFFVLDGAPEWLQTVSWVMPLRHLNDGMMDLMVRGEGATSMLAPMTYILSFGVAVGLAAALLFRRTAD
jgi:ABC-2 type transport system permease protein